MNHLQAKAVVDNLPNITPKESALVRTIAWCETQYGAGWDPKGKDPSKGFGSNNMGAVTGSYQGKFFVHKDSLYNKKTGMVETYETHFAVYPSPIEGFEAILRLLQKKWPAAIEAFPDFPAVSRAMYGYYLGTQTKEKAIETHAKWLAKGWASISAQTGEQFETPVSKALTTESGLLVGAALTIGAGLWLLRRKSTGAIKRYK